MKTTLTKVHSSCPPFGRRGHTCVVYNDSLYIFGGYYNGCCLNDFYKFNILEGWQKIETTNSPPARERHTAVIYKDRMYIFAGLLAERSKEAKTLNDLYRFDFTSQDWKKEEDGSFRYSHSGVVYESFYVIFGGRYKFEVDRDSHIIYLFDFSKGNWKSVITSGSIPFPRYDHTAVVYENKMYIFGGKFLSTLNTLDELNLDTMFWRQIIIPDNFPFRRGHCCFLYDKKLFVFGGKEFGDTVTNDAFYFNLKSLKCQKMKIEGNVKPIFYHSVGVIDNCIFIFGGCDHNGKYQKELLELRIETLDMKELLLKRQFVDVDLIFN